MLDFYWPLSWKQTINILQIVKLQKQTKIWEYIKNSTKYRQLVALAVEIEFSSIISLKVEHACATELFGMVQDVCGRRYRTERFGCSNSWSQWNSRKIACMCSKTVSKLLIMKYCICYCFVDYCVLHASFCGLGWAILTEQEYEENKTCAHLQNLTFSDSSVINLLGRSCLFALCVHCSYCISGWWLLPVDHTDCSIYTIAGPQGTCWNRGGCKLCNYFNWWCFCRFFFFLDCLSRILEQLCGTQCAFVWIYA